MATIYYADGRTEPTSPVNGHDFELDELQNVVGGYIEIVYLTDDRIMVINEEGKLKELPFNVAATELFRASGGGPDFIVGNALVCESDEVE